MKKINIILMFVFIFVFGSISVNAWIDCTPSSCGSGYTDNGIYCTGGSCYRNCTALVCDNNWAPVHSTTFGFDEPNEDEGFASSSSYNPTNSSHCYNFTYHGPPESDTYIFVSATDSPPTPPGDCDTEAIGGFKQGITPWFSGMTDYISGKDNEEVNYLRKIMRAHSDDDSNPDYQSDASIDDSIYCAPNTVACSNLGGWQVCDVDCYNQATNAYALQAYYINRGTPDATLYDGDKCGNAYCSRNRMNQVNYTVYESTADTIQQGDQSCSRTNEAPSVSNIKVLPLNATAGEDLVCNYTYIDLENYVEQNSSFEWWKNGVNQNINSETLDKNNLTVGAVWYCKVMPNDGMSNGGWVQSENNVTILSTVQNLVMKVDGDTVWNYSGYFSGPQTILDFTDELNLALTNCNPDAEGYCNINLTYHSDASGKLNLSRIGIYYENSTPSTAPSINSISATPSPQGFGENVTIEAEITDYDGVNDIETVIVEVSSPYGFENNYTLNYISGNTWRYLFTDFENGTYTYTVYATDSTELMDNDSGTFEMYVDLYINIHTLNDSYNDGELVNITDPPSIPPNYLISKDGSEWVVLKQDYLEQYMNYKFVYLNDSYYRVDWEWKNLFVKAILNNCSDLSASKKSSCVEDTSIAYFKGSKRSYSAEKFVERYFSNYDFNKVTNDFASLKNSPLPAEILKGNAEIIGEINPYHKDSGSFYIHLTDGYYSSNGVKIKWGFNSTIVEFNNSKTTENLTFSGNQNFTKYLTIEKNATTTVSYGAMNLKGYSKIGAYTGENFSTLIDSLDYTMDDITTNGTYFWTVAHNPKLVFKWYMNGTYTGTNFSIAAQSTYPEGIATDGTYLWVVDEDVGTVYKYTVGGTYQSSFSTAAEADDPYGITTDGSNIWVVDDINGIFKYTMAGTYTGVGYSLNTGNTDPVGIAQDETYFWVVDDNGNIYRYKMSDGSYFDFVSTGYVYLNGITGLGNHLWLYDDTSPGRVYKHYLSIATNNPYLEIGTPNANYEWSWAGIFNESNDTQTTNNFASAINTAFNNGACDCTGCAIDGNNCTIPFTFHSDTPGILQYSNINITYETLPPPNQSKIVNEDTLNSSFYLLMKVQYYDQVIQQWIDEATIVNDNSSRRLTSAEVLKLDTIWNPNAWDTSTSIHGNGTYRAYVAATDENDIILQNRNGTNITSTYSFTLNTSDVAPIVTLVSPVDSYDSSSSAIIFNCSATDDSALVNITLYGGWSGGWHANETKSLTGISDSAAFTKTISPDGSYQWNCLAYDAGGLSDWGNANRTFIIDSNAPQYSNILESPTDPATYVSGASYRFNITWTDNVGVDTVILEFNGVNYTDLSQNGDIYGREFTDLAAGTYNYVWYANDTDGYFNNTGTLTYTIDKVVDTVNLYLNGNQNDVSIDWGTESNVTATSISGSEQLFRDAVLVSNPEVAILAAGTYTYKANSTGNQNYSSGATVTRYLTVNKVTSSVNLLLNSSSSNITVGQGSTVNITGELIAGEGIIGLYLDGNQINSGNSPLTNLTLFDTIGIFNITVIYPTTQNYTSSSEAYFVIVPDVTSPTFSNYVNTSLNFRRYQNFVANITINDDVNLDYYTFSTNASGSWVDTKVEIFSVQYNASEQANISLAQGSQICWNYSANDSSGNNANSDIYCFIVQNTVPTATNIALTSSDNQNRTNGTLAGSWSYSDVDDDSEQDNETKWYNHSIEVTALANLTAINSSNTSKGENWVFSVRVYDGTDWSSWINSSNLTIQNTFPVIDNYQTSVTTNNSATYSYDYNASDWDDGEGVDTLTWYDNTTLFDINTTTGEISDSPTESEAGTYSIRVNVTDGTSWDEDIFTYIIEDTTSPAIEFSSPTETSNVERNQDWIIANISITETNLANFTYHLYNSTSLVNQTVFITYPTEINWTSLAEGTYYYNVTACDYAHNCNSTETRIITLGIVDESEGRTAIEQGIDNSILTGYNIYIDQQIYVGYLDNTQTKGTFDKVVTSGNQTWAFNYIVDSEYFTNITSLYNNTLVVWENQSLTTDQIIQQVQTLINQTKW